MDVSIHSPVSEASLLILKNTILVVGSSQTAICTLHQKKRGFSKSTGGRIGRRGAGSRLQTGSARAEGNRGGMQGLLYAWCP